MIFFSRWSLTCSHILFLCIYQEPVQYVWSKISIAHDPPESIQMILEDLKRQKCYTINSVLINLHSFQLAALKKEFQKKYSCEFCHKRFPTPSKLQRHQLVHSGEKPYLCLICLKGFTQRVHLNTHKKHAHPQMLLENQPQTQEDDNIAVPDMEEEPALAIASNWELWRESCNNRATRHIIEWQ